ncbi:MAG: 23S rRNA (guanosine(2251)-2'-O)-methyltransferase RlmB [Actinomycetia bacterium]|nr:23S rRNA (guanosine(2251)-2'-O)-methyltransferase RlmB [Actinomycetes bacterium]
MGPRRTAPPGRTGVSTTGPLVGRHAVREALRAGRPLTRLLLADTLHPREADAFRAMARERRVPVAVVPRARLDALAGGLAHQGVAAWPAAAPTRTEADMEAILAACEEPPFVLVLDDIQDPQNLGAILRVADGAGAALVVIPERRGAGLTPVVDRVSAGAASWVPVVRVVNLRRAITRLKDLGLVVWAADPGAARVYTEVDWRGPVALVVGNEGKGVRPVVLRECDGAVRLPMAGRLASLNAATAAAVLAFEVRRQRGWRIR